MMRWKYLKPGDIIDIIAPSFANGRKEKLYLEKAFELIHTLGFTPRCSEKFIDTKKSTFCANSDEFRYNDFKKALNAKDSKAIWAYRGGYGANKLLPYLMHDDKPSQTKPLIGFSDITTLSNFVYTKWKIPSIHGPVLSQYFKPSIPFDNFELIRDLLYGKMPMMKYEIFPLNRYAETSSSISAVLIGGNLMLMQHTLATPWQINPHNKIVFIEEVNERGYALDRVFEHLIHAEFFKQVRAIIIGDIIGKKERNGKDRCIDAVRDFTNKIDIPVYSVKNIGHGSINLPLPIGTNGTIKIKDNKMFLEVESGGE